MKWTTSLVLAVGALTCWPILGPAVPQTRPAVPPALQSAIEPQDVNSPEDRVAAKLAEYDQRRGSRLLREAALEASLHDGKVASTPALSLRQARQRVAGWLAILARLKRDIDPSFDFNARPSIVVEPPPSASGGQLPAGADPNDIKDPQARAAYIAEIAENDERLAKYGPMAQLFVSHPIILERALRSMLDAHDTLGLPTAEIRTRAAAADITPADRDTILNAFP